MQNKIKFTIWIFHDEPHWTLTRSAPIPLSIRCPITWFLLKMFLAPTKVKIINKLQFKSDQNLPFSRSKWFLAGGTQSDGFKENGNIMDSYVINIIRLTAYENTLTVNSIPIWWWFLCIHNTLITEFNSKQFTGDCIAPGTYKW